jgi:hypothetical protein
MQGIYVDGQRPKSKKAVREAVADDPSRVRIEATSFFGNDYDGPLSEAPDGSYAFVGPDVYERRDFYGTATVRGGRVSVK